MKLPASFNRVVDIGDSIKEYFQTKKDLRDWLFCLEEISISSSSQEKKLLKAVFKEAKSQVFKEIKRKKSNNDKMPTRDNEKTISDKVIVVEENLQAIIKNFEMCEKAKVKFVRAYPTWKDERSRNIKSLKEIGESIQRYRHNSNISTLVGTSTSLIGGGLLIALPFTGVLAAPAAFVGGVAVTLGSGTCIGTSITEKTLLKNKVTEAKAIVNEDKLSFKALDDLLIGANSLYKTLNDVLSIVVEDSIGKGPEIITEFVSLVDKMSKSASKHALIKKFVKFALKNLSPQFHLMTIFPRLLGLLVILILKCSINQTAFSLACITWEIVENNIGPIASASLYLIQPAVTANLIYAQKAVGTALTRGVLAGIGISLDVTRIVLTVIDIQEGSPSNVAQKIITAANEMEEEADVLEKVYTKLLNS